MFPVSYYVRVRLETNHKTSLVIWSWFSRQVEAVHIQTVWIIRIFLAVITFVFRIVFQIFSLLLTAAFLWNNWLSVPIFVSTFSILLLTRQILVCHYSAHIFWHWPQCWYLDFEIIVAEVLRPNIWPFNQFLIEGLLLLRAIVVRYHELSCVHGN